MNPLVSICIPTYNGARFIQKALDSIANQTYQNLEVVVSDDESYDDTLKIIKNYNKYVKCPVVILNHKPSSIAENWNNCVRNAKGKYIKFLFQDDVLEPKAVEKMVKRAELEPQIGLVYCKRKILVEGSEKRYQFWLANYSNLHVYWCNIDLEKKSLSGKSYLRDRNVFNFPDNKIAEPSATLIRKEVFDKIGYFNTKMKQNLDIEYWYRIMKQFNLSFIDEQLVSFRLHKMQATQTNNHNSFEENYQIKKMFMNQLFWSLSIKNKITLMYYFIKRNVKRVANFVI